MLGHTEGVVAGIDVTRSTDGATVTKPYDLLTTTEQALARRELQNQRHLVRAALRVFLQHRQATAVSWLMHVVCSRAKACTYVDGEPHIESITRVIRDEIAALGNDGVCSVTNSPLTVACVWSGQRSALTAKVMEQVRSFQWCETLRLPIHIDMPLAAT